MGKIKFTIILLTVVIVLAVVSTPMKTYADVGNDICGHVPKVQPTDSDKEYCKNLVFCIEYSGIIHHFYNYTNATLNGKLHLEDNKDGTYTISGFPNVPFYRFGMKKFMNVSQHMNGVNFDITQADLDTAKAYYKGVQFDFEVPEGRVEIPININDYISARNYSVIMGASNVSAKISEIMSQYKNVVIGIRQNDKEVVGDDNVIYYLSYNNEEQLNLKLNPENNKYICGATGVGSPYIYGTVKVGANSGSINNAKLGSIGMVGLIDTQLPKFHNLLVLKGNVVYENKKLDIYTEKEDLPHFDWKGDGIRIETPADKTSLITTKYKDTPGIFVNILLKTNERPPNKLFADIEEDISKNLKYKWKKTGTEEVVEGGKIKVTDIEVVNGFLERGETRYRIKGFIPIDTKGVYDLYISSEFEVLNVDNPLEEKRVFYEDTNTSIQIRNEQYSGVIDDVIEGNTGGSSNSNGSVETGAPQKPNSANPVDWLIYIVDLLNYWITSITDGFLTLISSLVNAFTEVSSELINAVEKFGQVFAMLPSPLPQLITLTITIACGTTIFKLVRG